MKKVKTLEAVNKLMERYETTHERIENYYGLLAYFALVQAAVAGNDTKTLQKCKNYLEQYPDCFEHPYYNFESYKVGGNAKAWLLFQGLMPQAECEIKEYAERTCQAPVSAEGIVCWPKKGMEHKVWIDVVTAITPFMLYAGLALGEEKYVDFAAEQCFKMYELFLDETNGLLHQTKGFMANPKRMSADHWGRGNGWGLVGLTELVRYLPDDNKYRAKAEEYFRDMMEALLPYQSDKGLWRQEIPEKLAWEESSGTSLILYGMGVGLRKGLLEENKFRPAFEKGIAGLGAYCMDEQFATYRSCPGCLCAGEGELKGTVEAYVTQRIPMRDELHSYGCMMLALVEAYKNGITEIEIKGLIGGVYAQ